MNEVEFWVTLDTLERTAPQLAARVHHILELYPDPTKKVQRVGAWLKDGEVRLLFEHENGFQWWDDHEELANMLIAHFVGNFNEIFVGRR